MWSLLITIGTPVVAENWQYWWKNLDFLTLVRIFLIVMESIGIRHGFPIQVIPIPNTLDSAYLKSENPRNPIWCSGTCKKYRNTQVGFRITLRELRGSPETEISFGLGFWTPLNILPWHSHHFSLLWRPQWLKLLQKASLDCTGVFRYFLSNMVDYKLLS